jgi:hypothetical protein
MGNTKDGSQTVKMSVTSPHSAMAHSPVPPVGVIRMGTLKPEY